MNYYGKIGLLVIMVIVSCCNNSARTTKDVSIEKDSINGLDAKDKFNVLQNNNIKLLVGNFETWFIKENSVYSKLVDETEIGPGQDEWDGRIPNYEKYKKGILESAEKSIGNSSLFTSSFVEKCKKIIAESSTDSNIDNLPSVLLNSYSAYLIQRIYFPTEKNINMNEIIEKKGENIYNVICWKEEIPIYDNPEVVLEIVNIDNEFKINNIFFKPQ